MTDVSKNVISGFSWTAVQTVGTKVISLVTQLVLAWLLVPEEFGKVSIATSLTSITFLIQGLGLSDVLISRSHMYVKIFDLAKSLALITSGICFVLTVLIGVIFGLLIYDDIEITFLVLIYSFAVPFNAMSIVADARLRIDLKFKQLTYTRLITFFTSNALLLLLVIIGLGIYGFVIAPLIAAVGRYFLIHFFAQTKHSFRFTLHHYKYLFASSLHVFLFNFFQTIIRNTDYLIIGAFVTTQAVGIYFMGYSLSVQVVGLLVSSLSPVFFPVLRKIPKEDTEKLRHILIKIVQVFSLFGMCFAFLQASLAEPIIRLFLNDKWLDTILIVQILSVGVGFNISGTIWAIALRLKGEFKTMAIYSCISAILFLIFIGLFTYIFATIGTAVAVSIFNTITITVILLLSLKKFNIGINLLLKMVLKYFFIAACIFVSANIIFALFFDNNYVLQIIFVGVLPLCLYFALLYAIDVKTKEILKTIFARLKLK